MNAQMQPFVLQVNGDVESLKTLVQKQVFFSLSYVSSNM